jgi:hypothetical protein
VMSILLHSTLSVSFWWMAWKTACYLQNRMPTVTVYGYMTPFESVRGIPPSLKRLRIWGCKAYVLKPKTIRPTPASTRDTPTMIAGMKCTFRNYVRPRPVQ